MHEERQENLALAKVSLAAQTGTLLSDKIMPFPRKSRIENPAVSPTAGLSAESQSTPRDENLHDASGR
jgi:hypothetical protein